jgi:deazaflavin-dependent oxidoreductase (nitroreductase family)
MKHQIVHVLQKYVLNPPIKMLFAIGVVPPGYALLETTGRKTGKARRTPVGDARVGDRLWIVAEHGMKAGYVRNIKQNPRVRLKLREGVSRSLAHRHGAPAMGRRSARAATVACQSSNKQHSEFGRG